jgi:hypothetical protein
MSTCRFVHSCLVLLALLPGACAKTSDDDTPVPDAATTDAAEPSRDVRPDETRTSDAAAASTDAAPRTDAAATAVLYMDRIQDGNISDFTPSSGAWAVCAQGSRKAYCQNDPATPVVNAPPVAFVGDPSWTDYEVKVMATIADENGRAMLAVRAGDAGYVAVHVGVINGVKKWNLARYVTGMFTTGNGYGHLGDGAFAFQPGVPFPLRLRVRGQTVTVYSSSALDKPYTSTSNVTVPTMNASGRIGIGTRNTTGSFTDVVVTAL